ncbi:hypothetical protein V6N13_089390 [Hibiscus sabdariffa]
MKSRSMNIGHGDGGIRKLKGTNLRKDFVTEIELFDTSETTNLDKYLGDKCVCEIDDFDILSWWSMQTMNYPILMRMARDVLAISVSIVVSHNIIMIEQILLALENMEEC